MPQKDIFTKSLSRYGPAPKTHEERCLRIKDFFNPVHSRISLKSVNMALLDRHGVSLSMVRDDLLHPMIAGNKWWKLKHALLDAAKRRLPMLLTFGGPYSNHILAVAAAGRLFGFKTVGIIRGEEARPLNPVLVQARQWGMQLVGISRAQYRKKTEPRFLSELESDWGPCMILPEGGSGSFAVQGASEMVRRMTKDYDILCCPVGTGGTMAGMVLGAREQSKVLGFSVLKGGNFLARDIRGLLQVHSPVARSWELVTRYHFGGYARSDDALLTFCNLFRSSQGVSLDPVYTGKMMCGIVDMLGKGRFRKGSRIVAWHTGNAWMA
jgi:1-aminocyclopropane-1-carboxylate deaminase